MNYKIPEDYRLKIIKKEEQEREYLQIIGFVICGFIILFAVVDFLGVQFDKDNGDYKTNYSQGVKNG